MTRSLKKWLLALTAICIVGTVTAQKMEDRITFSLDNWDGLYRIGETVAIHAEVAEPFEAVQELWINGLRVSSEKVTIKAGKYDILTRCDNEPTSVMLRLAHPTKKKDFTDVGYGVGLEQVKPGFEKPNDFMAWWQKQVKKMRKEKIDAKLVEVKAPKKFAKDYVVYDIEINCREGGAPARGYLAMPKNVPVKSLPICIMAHGGGVRNLSNRSQIGVALRYASAGGGAIAIDLNAHGMLNDQPQEYYDELEKTTLNNYIWREIKDRDSYYCRGLYLRMQRTLDYLCTLPEWDGERVLVLGGSQGGAQTAALSGLDSRVTHALIREPGMMDLGADLVGRKSGPPYLGEQFGHTNAFLKALPYFDMAFFMPHIKAKVLFECGLVDMSCTPTSMMAGYNMATCEKQLLTYPFRAHRVPKGKYKEVWNERINKTIKEFINEALK